MTSRTRTTMPADSRVPRDGCGLAAQAHRRPGGSGRLRSRVFLRRQPWPDKRIRCSGKFTRTGRTESTLKSSPAASRKSRTFSTRSVSGRAAGGGVEGGGLGGSLAGALMSFEFALSGRPRLLLLFSSSFRPHLPPCSLTLGLHWAVPVGLSCSTLSSSALLPSLRTH